MSGIGNTIGTSMKSGDSVYKKVVIFQDSKKNLRALLAPPRDAATNEGCIESTEAANASDTIPEEGASTNQAEGAPKAQSEVPASKPSKQARFAPSVVSGETFAPAASWKKLGKKRVSPQCSPYDGS